ncbi:hypothetical protein C1N70_18880 [Cytobacillus firmus]
MSCGRRGKCETPQAKPRRLAFLPAGSLRTCSGNQRALFIKQKKIKIYQKRFTNCIIVDIITSVSENSKKEVE